MAGEGGRGRPPPLAGSGVRYGGASPSTGSCIPSASLCVSDDLPVSTSFSLIIFLCLCLYVSFLLQLPGSPSFSVTPRKAGSGTLP